MERAALADRSVSDLIREIGVVNRGELRSGADRAVDDEWKRPTRKPCCSLTTERTATVVCRADPVGDRGEDAVSRGEARLGWAVDALVTRAGGHDLVYTGLPRV
jgi:hypothetical protein